MARFGGYISTRWAALVRPESAADLVLDRERGARFSRFLALAVAVLYAVYGLSMGVYRGAAATVFSALKLPLLYLATVTVCFPAFYVLNCLYEHRLSARQCLRLLLIATSTNALALASFAPVSLFFSLTTSKAGYTFIVLLHVAVFMVAALLSVIAIGLIYGITGTLNMADLAVKVPHVAAGDQALLKTGALLLLLVFAIKAAFVPLHWWLPATYAAASAPVAALFAIMTKVGAYAIIRVYGTIFGADAGALADMAAPWILPAALVTLFVGAMGILASRTLLDLASFSIIASMGTLLIAVGLFDVDALTTALYYLVHSTLAAAALFLLVDLVSERRGQTLDALVPANPISQSPLLGALFLLTAIAVIGLPPLSGFIGKLMILNATYENPQAWLIWGLVLGAALMMTIAIARAGSIVFWETDGRTTGSTWANARVAPMVVVALLVCASALLAVFAGPVVEALHATAEQALDPARYIDAVLGGGQATQAPGG